MKREITQIIVSKYLIIKCNDGTMWQLINDKWILLPPIPQDNDSIN